MRFVFDTSVLIDYLHDDDVAADALTVAFEQGAVLISSLISLMELFLPPTKSKAETEEEITRILSLGGSHGMQFIPCSPRAQEWALEILRHHRSPLGKNALTDSLIMATGITRKACLVTTDNRWFDVARDGQRRALPLPGLKVISPTELVQRF